MNKKFLSFLLALCMILGMVPFTFAASAEDGETTSDSVYYVSNMYGDDSNDGSEQNPFKTISKAVNAIGTSNNGTVMIVDGKTTDGEGNTVREYTMYPMYNDEGYGKHYGTNSVLYYDAPTHTGTITYKGIDSKNGTAAICFASDGNNMGLNGPSKFENVTLIEGLNISKSLFTRGYPVEFSNVSHTRTDEYSKNSEQATTANSGLRDGESLSFSIFGDASSPQNRETDYHFGANSVKLHSISFTNWNTTAVSITKDLKVTVDSGATVGEVNLFGSNANFVGKNINLVLNQAVTTLKNGTAGTFNAIQVVMNNGVNVAYTAPTLSTITAGTWVLRGATGVTMDTTDTAGTFANKTESPVYAYNGGNVIYSAASGANLIVPAGEWNVTTDLSTAKGTKVDQDGGYKWVEDNGTYTYKYEGTVGTKTYYVMRGANETIGTGTESNPVDRSIADIINEIEADASAKDGVIVIKNNPQYVDSSDPDDAKHMNGYFIENSVNHHFTYWTRPNAHTKSITIKGATDGSSDVIAVTATATTGDITPHGPMTFENITILRCRSNDEGIMSGGYDLTLKDTVKFYQTDQTSHPNASGGYDWYFKKNGDGNFGFGEVGNTYDFVKFGSGRNESDANGGTFEIRQNRDLALGVDWKSKTYENDATLDVNLGGHALTVYWAFSSNVSVVYKKNLNLILGNVSTFNNKMATEGTTVKGNVTVKGNLNVILPASVTYTAPLDYYGNVSENFKVEGNTYIMKTATADMLTVGDGDGKFNVVGGDPVYAYRASEKNVIYYSVGGVLTVPAGEWNVTTDLQSVKDSVASYVKSDSWTDDSQGKMTGQFTDGYTPGTYYVMKDGDGDGLTKDTPMGSVAAAIAAIEADDGVTEGTIVIMSNPKYKEGGEKEGEWFPVYNTETGTGEKNPVPNYTAWDASNKSHTKHITVTGEDGTDTILATNTRANSGDLVVIGPTTFKNISLLRLRYWQEGIMSSGYDLTLDNVKLYSMNNDTMHGYQTSDEWWGFDQNHKIVPILDKDTHTTGDSFYFIKFGAGRSQKTGNGGTLTVKSNEKTYIAADTIGGAVSYSENAELNVDTQNNEVDINLAWKGEVTYAKNLNLVFGNISKLTIDALNTVTVGGALQVIHPANITWTKPEKVTVAGGTYELLGDASLLSTTSTAGTYKVNDSSKTVYAYTADGSAERIYSSTNGTLTLPKAGKWNFTDSLDAVKAQLGEVDLYDGGDGTLTVVKIVKGTYYVMYSESGVGTQSSDDNAGNTPNAPFRTMKKAVETIENDSTLTAGTVVVMNNPYYKNNGGYFEKGTDAGNGSKIYYLAWNDEVAHNKTITVRGFEDDSESVITNVQTSYQMTGDIQIKGPTKFENITIFRNRGDEGIETGGYDVSFADDVLFKCGSPGDWYNGIPSNPVMADANSVNILKFGSGRDSSTGNGGMMTLNTKTSMLFTTDWQTSSYTDTAGFTVDTNGNKLTVVWGRDSDDSAKAVTYKDFNIVLRNVSELAQTNPRSTTVNITGTFQFIHKSTTTIGAFPVTFTYNSDKYYEILDDNGLIEPTDESLIFKLVKPTVVYATTKDGTERLATSARSTLDLSKLDAGTYVIHEEDSSKLVTFKFPSEYGFDDIAALPGDGSVTLPTLENESYREFKGWKMADGDTAYKEYPLSGLTAGSTVTFTEAVYDEYTDTRFVFLDATNGDDSKDGSSKDTAVKTLAKAITILDGYGNEITTRKVVVIGEYKCADWKESVSSSKAIVVCGDGSGQSLFDINHDYVIPADLTFEDIEIAQKGTDNSKFLFSGDHKLVFGKDVTNIETNGKKVDVALGVTHADANTKHPKLEAGFNSGTFKNVYLSEFYVPATWHADTQTYTPDTASMAGADITIGGATVTDFIVGGMGYSNGDNNVDGGTYRMGNSIFTDDVKITVNSGSLGSVNIGSYQGTYAENINFVLLNNAGKTTVASGITEKFGENNTYVVTTEKAASDGTHLEMTKTLGTYNVVGGDRIAVATKADGTKVVSVKKGDSHTLTLGACTATVTYVEKMEYVYNFGKNFATNPDTLEIYNLPDGFKITDVEPVIHEGYYFEGWEKIENGDGSAVTDSNKYDTVNLAFGDKFKAVYTPYSTEVTDGDFKILGIQIRLAGESNKDVEQGLRYVVDLQDSFNNALNALNTNGEVAYGTLVLPTDLTHGHTMKIDPATVISNNQTDTPKGMPMYNEYEAALPDGTESRADNWGGATMSKGHTTTWSSGSWTSTDGPSVVPGKKIFSRNNNGTQYTVCLTGIDEANYGRHYSVTGYAVYTDRNGNRRAVYTDYYQTNLYRAAEAAMEDPNGKYREDSNIYDIVDYYEDTRVQEFEAKYNTTKQSMTDVAAAGYVSYKTAVQDAKSHELTYVDNKGFYLYQDGINSNGVLVNEVEFNFFGSEEPLFTVIEAGDTHLNSVNDKDWANQESCILATYKGRESGRNGSSVYNINSLLNFASHYDQLVIAGDVLDYFSYGCAEMVKKLIIDRDKNAMVLMGNHEDTVHMQNVNHTCPAGGVMTTNDTWTELVKEGIWSQKETIIYQKKILEKGENKVMLIGIDSSDHNYSTYGENIRNWLAQDIAEARAGVEGGQETIPIILFQHVPLNPNGGEEEWLPLYYGSADTGGTELRDGVYKCNVGTRGASASSLIAKKSNKEYSKLDLEVYELITSSADVIKGIFGADWHKFMYMEVDATKGVGGEATVIPQYVAAANQSGALNCVKITIK